MVSQQFQFDANKLDLKRVLNWPIPRHSRFRALTSTNNELFQPVLMNLLHAEKFHCEALLPLTTRKNISPAGAAAEEKSPILFTFSFFWNKYRTMPH